MLESRFLLTPTCTQLAASAFSACQPQIINTGESSAKVTHFNTFPFFFYEKVDYQINGNCSITAAVRNDSYLIELGFHFCDFYVCFWQLPSVCLGPALLISYSDWDGALFQQLFLTSLLSLSLSLSLALPPSLPLSLFLPFSRFLAHSNDCHGNHQKCQTTNKRKSLNMHLSQKEQNRSLIMVGTIKTVHIYWQGTSHRSICSWIPKNEGRNEWWCWIWMSIWWYCNEKKQQQQNVNVWEVLKTGSFVWQMEQFFLHFPYQLLYNVLILCSVLM